VQWTAAGRADRRQLQALVRPAIPESEEAAP